MPMHGGGASGSPGFGEKCIRAGEAGPGSGVANAYALARSERECRGLVAKCSCVGAERTVVAGSSQSAYAPARSYPWSPTHSRVHTRTHALARVDDGGTTRTDGLNHEAQRRADV